MGFINSDSLSSPQVEGGKQSVIRTDFQAPSSLSTLLFLLVFVFFNMDLEIYITSFFFIIVEDLHSSSVGSFVIDIFWVPIL